MRAQLQLKTQVRAPPFASLAKAQVPGTNIYIYIHIILFPVLGFWFRHICVCVVVTRFVMQDDEANFMQTKQTSSTCEE